MVDQSEKKEMTLNEASREQEVSISPLVEKYNMLVRRFETLGKFTSEEKKALEDLKGHIDDIAHEGEEGATMLLNELELHLEEIEDVHKTLERVEPLKIRIDALLPALGILERFAADRTSLEKKTLSLPFDDDASVTMYAAQAGPGSRVSTKIEARVTKALDLLRHLEEITLDEHGEGIDEALLVSTEQTVLNTLGALRKEIERDKAKKKERQKRDRGKTYLDDPAFITSVIDTISKKREKENQTPDIQPLSEEALADTVVDQLGFSDTTEVHRPATKNMSPRAFEARQAELAAQKIEFEPSTVQTEEERKYQSARLRKMLKRVSSVEELIDFFDPEREDPFDLVYRGKEYTAAAISQALAECLWIPDAKGKAAFKRVPALHGLRKKMQTLTRQASGEAGFRPFGVAPEKARDLLEDKLLAAETPDAFWNIIKQFGGIPHGSGPVTHVTSYGQLRKYVEPIFLNAEGREQAEEATRILSDDIDEYRDVLLDLYFPEEQSDVEQLDAALESAHSLRQVLDVLHSFETINVDDTEYRTEDIAFALANAMWVPAKGDRLNLADIPDIGQLRKKIETHLRLQENGNTFIPYGAREGDSLIVGIKQAVARANDVFSLKAAIARYGGLPRSMYDMDSVLPYAMIVEELDRIFDGVEDRETALLRLDTLTYEDPFGVFDRVLDIQFPPEDRDADEQSLIGAIARAQKIDDLIVYFATHDIEVVIDGLVWESEHFSREITEFIWGADGDPWQIPERSILPTAYGIRETVIALLQKEIGEQTTFVPLLQRSEKDKKAIFHHVQEDIRAATSVQDILDVVLKYGGLYDKKTKKIVTYGAVYKVVSYLEEDKKNRVPLTNDEIRQRLSHLPQALGLRKRCIEIFAPTGPRIDVLFEDFAGIQNLRRSSSSEQEHPPQEASTPPPAPPTPADIPATPVSARGATPPPEEPTNPWYDPFKDSTGGSSATVEDHETREVPEAPLSTEAAAEQEYEERRDAYLEKVLETSSLLELLEVLEHNEFIPLSGSEEEYQFIGSHQIRKTVEHILWHGGSAYMFSKHHGLQDHMRRLFDNEQTVKEFPMTGKSKEEIDTLLSAEIAAAKSTRELVDIAHTFVSIPIEGKEFKISHTPQELNTYFSDLVDLYNAGDANKYHAVLGNITEAYGLRAKVREIIEGVGPRRESVSVDDRDTGISVEIDTGTTLSTNQEKSEATVRENELQREERKEFLDKLFQADSIPSLLHTLLSTWYAPPEGSKDNAIGIGHRALELAVVEVLWGVRDVSTITKEYGIQSHIRSLFEDPSASRCVQLGKTTEENEVFLQQQIAAAQTLEELASIAQAFIALPDEKIEKDADFPSVRYMWRVPNQLKEAKNNYLFGNENNYLLWTGDLPAGYGFKKRAHEIIQGMSEQEQEEEAWALVVEQLQQNNVTYSSLLVALSHFNSEKKIGEYTFDYISHQIGVAFWKKREHYISPVAETVPQERGIRKLIQRSLSKGAPGRIRRKEKYKEKFTEVLGIVEKRIAKAQDFEELKSILVRTCGLPGVNKMGEYSGVYSYSMLSRGLGIAFDGRGFSIEMLETDLYPEVAGYRAAVKRLLKIEETEPEGDNTLYA